MSSFTARELETQSLLEHVRKQRSVLVLGRGGIGKSALLEHAAGILEGEILVVNLERVAPFANFLRDLFNHLWTARALDAFTFLPDDALYADLEESRKLWIKLHPNNDTKARSLTDSLEKYAGREARAVIVINDLTGISPTIVRGWLNSSRFARSSVPRRSRCWARLARNVLGRSLKNSDSSHSPLEIQTRFWKV